MTRKVVDDRRFAAFSMALLMGSSRKYHALDRNEVVLRFQAMG
jgi:hypothetical protein